MELTLKSERRIHKVIAFTLGVILVATAWVGHRLYYISRDVQQGWLTARLAELAIPEAYLEDVSVVQRFTDRDDGMYILENIDRGSIPTSACIAFGKLMEHDGEDNTVSTYWVSRYTSLVRFRCNYSATDVMTMSVGSTSMVPYVLDGTLGDSLQAGVVLPESRDRQSRKIRGYVVDWVDISPADASEVQTALIVDVPVAVGTERHDLIRTFFLVDPELLPVHEIESMQEEQTLVEFYCRDARCLSVSN